MRNNSWIALTMGMVVVFSSLCFAALPNSSLSSLSDSVKVEKYSFGVPNVQGDKFYFTNGAVVEVNMNQPNSLEDISERNSNVASPAGIAIGMSEKAIGENYGAADKIEKDDRGNVEYQYISADYKKKMTFKVSDGVIKKIECYRQ